MSDSGIFVFKHPFTCVIAGASGSGKTHFLTELLLHSDETVDRPIHRVIYCYGANVPDTFQKLRARYPDLETYEGINPELKFNPRINNLIILDDLMLDTVKSETVCNYFTKTSTKSNLSVILLTQNLFQQGSFARTINRNSNYIIYFKNPRDSQQIQVLARQMFPGRSSVMLESFADATSRPHGYLWIDFRQDTEDQYRLKTNLLPSDPDLPAVYVPKKY